MSSIKRTIGLPQATALTMGSVLGSGILILPSFTAELAGPASVLSWILLCLLSIPIAYSYAKLGLKFNHFGGISNIVQHAFGYIWSTLTGWLAFAWGATGNSVAALAGAAYVTQAFHLSREATYALALAFLIFAFVSNYFGLKISGAVSLVLSGVVLALLLVTIAFTFPAVDGESFKPFAPQGVSGIGQACVVIFWAMFGWENITHLVPELKNPKRDVMRSMWISVGVIGIVYTLLSLVTVGTRTYGTGDAAAPLTVLMSRGLGIGAGAATAIIACIVCTGTLNAYLASSSRLGYSMGQEKKLPSWFAAMNKRQFPHRTGLFLFLVNAGALVISYAAHISVNQLMLIPTTLGIVVYVIASLSCLRLLWNDKKGRIFAFIASVSCLAIVPFSNGYAVVPIIVAIGCLCYLGIGARQIRRSSDAGLSIKKQA